MALDTPLYIDHSINSILHSILNNIGNLYTANMENYIPYKFGSSCLHMLIRDNFLDIGIYKNIGSIINYFHQLFFICMRGS